MLFTTHQYLIFFVVVFTVYWAMPWQRLRVYLLLAASFYFYATWNQWLALLVTGTATLDYFLARGIDSVQRRGLRRFFAGTSIAVNLGVLGFFKYTNFFLSSLYEAFNIAEADRYLLKVIIPFGISFYTFEAISYTVDVYQKRIKAERNLPNFLLFILFFPHLVAGPIVRARDFLRQAHRPKRWSWIRAQHGVQLIVIGLFKKLAIADFMAIYSDRVWLPDQNIAVLSTQAAWMAVIAFTIRVYCDFSGYSDIALGCAHLLGYKLTVNFRMPYISLNIAEFWRRWHISLSNWLRDYIFIPLGGSRGGFWFTARNLIITFGLGGLWHGATWCWLVWGLVHATMLIVHRAFREFAEARPSLKAALETKVGITVRWLVTLFFVTLSMAFAQPSLTAALTVLKKMFVWQVGPDIVGLPVDQNRLWWTVYLVVAAHVVVLLGLWKWVWRRLPGPVLGAACAILFVTAQVLSPDTANAFMYFQF
ncbi:MAG TPA: MBOAT family O-acyltransferase [Gemmataceae bacterium]|jgi:alginate O-acetyltransferase complex protein AlgI|nr:MBOAT family O-acyltransferase [Gemmataceae bacterium]